MIITCLVLISLNYQHFSQYKIEKLARQAGMIYPEDIKAMEKNK